MTQYSLTFPRSVSNSQPVIARTPYVTSNQYLRDDSFFHVSTSVKLSVTSTTSLYVSKFTHSSSHIINLQFVRGAPQSRFTTSRGTVHFRMICDIRPSVLTNTSEWTVFSWSAFKLAIFSRRLYVQLQGDLTSHISWVIMSCIFSITSVFCPCVNVCVCQNIRSCKFCLQIRWREFLLSFWVSHAFAQWPQYLLSRRISDSRSSSFIMTSIFYSHSSSFPFCDWSNVDFFSATQAHGILNETHLQKTVLRLVRLLRVERPFQNDCKIDKLPFNCKSSPVYQLV